VRTLFIPSGGEGLIFANILIYANTAFGACCVTICKTCCWPKPFTGGMPEMIKMSV